MEICCSWLRKPSLNTLKTPLPMVVAVSGKVEAERLERKARRLAQELIRGKRERRRG